MSWFRSSRRRRSGEPVAVAPAGPPRPARADLEGAPAGRSPCAGGRVEGAPLPPAAARQPVEAISGEAAAGPGRRSHPNPNEPEPEPEPEVAHPPPPEFAPAPAPEREPESEPGPGRVRGPRDRGPRRLRGHGRRRIRVPAHQRPGPLARRPVPVALAGAAVPVAACGEEVADGSPRAARATAMRAWSKSNGGAATGSGDVRRPARAAPESRAPGQGWGRGVRGPHGWAVVATFGAGQRGLIAGLRVPG